MLYAIGSHITPLASRDELFARVSQALVRHGGYRAAWLVVPQGADLRVVAHAPASAMAADTAAALGAKEGLAGP
jgi:hypothetical protein